MKNLRFICAQPSTMYYAWQVEVMINNFIEMGVNPNFIDVVSTDVLSCALLTKASKTITKKHCFFDHDLKYCLLNFIPFVYPLCLK